jgi:ribosomal protein S18 acetylase RimI-like enzyme
MSTAPERKYVTDLRTLPGDAAAAWRSAGASGVWTELRRRTVDRAGGFVRNLVLEADLTTTRRGSLARGIEIRPFACPDWSSLGDLVSQRLHPVFTAALSADRQCLIAWRGQEALGYIWFSPRTELRYENFDLPLPADANYLWQIQVARMARRQGIGAALIKAGFRQALQDGFRRSWMVTAPDNAAAQNTISSVAECRLLGSISRVKVVSWMQCRYLPMPQARPLEPHPK